MELPRRMVIVGTKPMESGNPCADRPGVLNTKEGIKIYGKTGTGTDGTAWFIGFVEKENTNIYFAIYLDDDSSNEISGIKAQEIAFNILEE